MPRSLPCLLAVSVLGLSVVSSRGQGDPNAPASTSEEQLKKFHLPPGFEIQLVAAEPEIQKPINLNFDAAGRLWATGSELYPWPAKRAANGELIAAFEKNWEDARGQFNVGNKAPQPAESGRDTVRVLSDFGPDGRARKIETFADGLNIPTGVQPLPRKPGAKGDTAIVFSIPNIWRMEDTDGDGKADVREPLYTGFGFKDTHGMSSSYIYWIDGWIYGTHGFSNHSEIKDRRGNVLVMDSGNTYRFRPDGSKIEYYTHGQTNPFGLAFDELGNLYSADSHSKPVYMLLRGGYYEGIGKQHDGLGFAPRITDDDHGSSAIAGIAYYADDKWPEEFRGNLFNGNPVTRRINRDRLEWHGSTPKAIRMPDFLTSDDPWFRPVQVKLGPDGALWIADFYNPIIGHYEMPLTDPRRDHAHGRIWRVVWKGDAARDARAPSMLDLTKLDAQGLVEKLADRNLIVRTLATHELVERVGKEGLAALVSRVETWPGHQVDDGTTYSTATGEKVDFFDDEPWSRLHLGTRALGIGSPLWVLERTGLLSDELLTGMTSDSEDIVRLLAFDIAGERATWSSTLAEKVSKHLSDDWNMAACAAIDAFARHPRSDPVDALDRLLRGWVSVWQTEPVFDYTVRIALRESLAAPGYYAAIPRLSEKYNLADPKEWADYEHLLAEVSLAVSTPEAADFLLAHLERTKFAGPRADEFLRHAMLHLPAERLPEITALVGKMQDAPVDQRLAIVEGLDKASRQRGVKLPEGIAAWAQRVMIDALASTDEGALKRAIETVRESKSDAKLAPLTKIIADTSRPGPLRSAALDAIANLDGTVDSLVRALNDPSSMTLRKRAAELLAQRGGDAARAPLLAALLIAPWELATTVAAGLAKEDAGCEALLALIESGKTAAALLRNKTVAAALEKRAQPFKARAAGLTKDLPPEDARLDGVIAERVAAFRSGTPKADHGAQLFQQQCAVCHKVKNSGGNVGPNLDGMAARGLHRVVEDILDPNRNVDPAFAQTILETTEGTMLAGTGLRTEGELLTVTDAQGKAVSIEKAKVKSQTRTRLSLMPPTFEQTLSLTDFNDLLSFLLTPQ